MAIVERSAEFFRLEELLANGSLSEKVVLVEGAAGTGKTCLLQEFTRDAERSGATCLYAAASSAERDLPLSAVGHLFRDRALPAKQMRQAARLLSDGVLAVTVSGTPDGGIDDAAVRIPATVLARLSTILLELAERGPLVIAVDDIQHADPSSLRLLLYLARRARTGHILLIFTECLRPGRPQSMLHTDLLLRPGVRRLRLRPLSAEGVAAVLDERFDPVTARRLAPECHQATGGNPLLLSAIIEDHRMSGTEAGPDSLIFDDAFRQAVLTCIHRSEATQLARSLAALPRGATADVLGDLAQLDADSVADAHAVLRATGLADDEGLRHEAVGAAVLSGMRQDERTVLYLCAAQLLHEHGAPATAVADRLMAADQAPFPWAAKVLRDAAAAAGNKVDEAIGLLRLALRGCADTTARSAVQMELARAEWQVDPSVAARHLPELVQALRDGLPSGTAVGLIAWMLWLGRVDDARALATDSFWSSDGPGPVPEVTFWWLQYACSGLADEDALTTGPAWPRSRGTTETAPTFSGRVEEMLTSVFTKGDHAAAVAQSEWILGQAGSAVPLATGIAAIAALIYADEPHRAEHWCRILGRTAPRTPLANALTAVLYSLIHHRRGELDAAVVRCREAFDLVPPKGWGILVGIPLGTVVAALTAAGRHAEVEEYLDTPLPEAAFHTPLVLPYLQALGRHYLATGRPHAALAEFRACGDLMMSWGVDVPGFVPWRTDLARALIALGDLREARELASDELARLADDRPRTRGIALRVLAAASEHGGLDLLTEAVRLLEASGDRLESAYALADMCAVHCAAGDARRARVLEQRARALAAECGVVGAVDPPTPGPGERERGAEPEPDPLTRLSDAEQRVTALAADGYTNRQIAHRLRVTVSTVEQHLTRAYRKLGISRRADLPLTLLLGPQDSPVGPGAAG